MAPPAATLAGMMMKIFPAATSGSAASSDSEAAVPESEMVNRSVELDAVRHCHLPCSATPIQEYLC